MSPVLLTPSDPLRVCLLPVLVTAILLLATGSSWRCERRLLEPIGLGTGVLALSVGLGWLPAVIFKAALPVASIIMTWMVLAESQWRFAPDTGQAGWTWAIQAAARPTLGTVIGATLGFGPMLIWPESHLSALACVLTVSAGLLCAHAIDPASSRDRTLLPTSVRSQA